MKFYFLPSLTSFHIILGNDTFKELSVIIHTKDNFMTINDPFLIKLLQLVSQDVTHVIDGDNHLNNFKKKKFMKSMISKNLDLFSDPDEKLTYAKKGITNIQVW